jgi:hypothetical protein
MKRGECNKRPVIRTRYDGVAERFDSRNQAQEVAHVTHSTIDRWLRDGREHDGWTYKYERTVKHGKN